MIRAAAGLTKHGFWDAGKGVWVQLNIPLTPLNRKGCERRFGEIPYHTNTTMSYRGTFGLTHVSVADRRRGPSSGMGKRRGVRTSKWQRRRAIGRSQ